VSPTSPILMCPPTYFGVEYVINPWMDGHIGEVDRGEAQRQWDQLHKILSGLTEVNVVDAIDGLPDMCFVANAGLRLEDRFVPSVFRVAQRAPEVPHYTQWFLDAGDQIEPVGPDRTFEGEGDALFHPGQVLLWAGYGVRSGLLAHRDLTQTFRCEVASLRLTDERFYHLDTCFCPLPDGAAMYYPAAFDDRSLALIRSRVDASKRIEVNDDDAMGFCCNAVRLGTTIVVNHASNALQSQLKTLGYDVITTSLSEFIKAGGAAKCLTLLLQQDMPESLDTRPIVDSTIETRRVRLEGQLLDSGLMNKALDAVTDSGASFRIEQFQAGLRRDQPSSLRLRFSTPDAEHLTQALEDLQSLGAEVLETNTNVTTEPAPGDGVAPEDFYSTTIYPTDVRINDQWVQATHQRMDVALVIDTEIETNMPVARCTLMRELQKGDQVVVGIDGVTIRVPDVNRSNEAFSFMSAGVSSERRVERVVEELASEMKRIRARNGRIALVAGPVVIHTGGSDHLSTLIRAGFVQALLTGNALPTHDIELNMFGTSLGVDMKRGVGVPHGHRHHLRAINRVRAEGSIRAAVESGVITGGIMYECVQHDVDYVLAGSIRDDGPLPETLMDLCEAQTEYARAIEGAEMILMLSTMLHSIGVGNMTRAGVRLICVDINPAVVTKLADRGSIESTGIVTDVGLFLNLLASHLTAGSET
jgi:lysine-ketoglutarate reductase/saccharopine dehydrogenase-like protein (TIGR00300 family)